MLSEDWDAGEEAAAFLHPFHSQFLFPAHELHVGEHAGVTQAC